MATNILTQVQLKELLHYDPATGVFTNAQKRGRCHRAVPNSPAGYARKDKYLIIQLASKKYYAHHLAWLYGYGALPSAQVDHIDRNPANNRLANLRLVTRSENVHNSSPSRKNTSGYRGVTWNGKNGKWQAQIMANCKYHFLGLFDDATVASQVYLAAVRELHPTRPLDT
jgi:hypothetical protein